MVKDMKNPTLATRIFTIRLQPFSFECMSSGSYRGREGGRMGSGREGQREERERGEDWRERESRLIVVAYLTHRSYRLRSLYNLYLTKSTSAT